MMNWRQIYGDDEFAVRAPIYWSDIVRRRKQREVDMEDLKQRAIDYAKVHRPNLSSPDLSHFLSQRQCETYSVSYEEVSKGEHSIEWPPMKKEVDLEARVDRENRKKPTATPIKTESAETGTSLNTHLTTTIHF